LHLAAIPLRSVAAGDLSYMQKEHLPRPRGAAYLAARYGP